MRQREPSKTARYSITWERHGDILVMVSEGWRRAVIFRDRNCSNWTGIGNFGSPELREFNSRTMRDLKRALTEQHRRLFGRLFG